MDPTYSHVKWSEIQVLKSMKGTSSPAMTHHTTKDHMIATELKVMTGLNRTRPNNGSRNWHHVFKSCGKKPYITFSNNIFPYFQHQR